MECCAPFCKNTSDNVSPGISFLRFPSDVGLRAAWLRALGQQDIYLPDSAVVCSQHFLADDIYETESGLKQIVTGAIPSTVQVCMICLDTDSKMFLMSKHKLEEGYEKLTGHPLCDQGNLKPTLCTHCARRLINFSRFRDQSLTSRTLMMDLIEKHKLITRQTIKMVNCTKNQLTSNLVMTMLGPDPCDLYILEDPSKDKQTEAFVHIVTVKKEEESYDCASVDEEMEVTNEDDSNANNINDEFVASDDKYVSYDNIKLEPKPLVDDLCKAPDIYRSVAKQVAETQDPLKCERAPFQCTLCSEEFVCELAYMQHVSTHIQNRDGDWGPSQVCKPHTAVSSRSSHSSLLTENKQDIQMLKEDPLPSTDSALTSVAPWSAGLATNRKNEVQAEDADTIQKRKQAFKVKKSYFCESCEYTTVTKPNLVYHTRTHTGEKPFICKYCPYKTIHKNYLVTHMKTHTGEKPYNCNLCDYKCVQKYNLIQHMRTHTGEKPFSCELCEFKTARKAQLLKHVNTHTGEKPFSCGVCEYKCAQSSNLARHMRKHTGEKPYVCMLCNYKYGQKVNLEKHMRTHTDDELPLL